MEIDNYFLRPRQFISVTSALAISSFIGNLLVNETLKECKIVSQNSFCSFLHLCEKVNRFVCVEKPHKITNTEIAIESVFFISFGLAIGYSIAFLFDKYVLHAHEKASRA